MVAAPYALTDLKLVVNSVNLSTWCTKAALEISADELESTAFGSTYRTRIGGLKDYNLAAEFNQDFAASAIDVTLQPLLGTVVAFTCKSTSAATGATNPEYQGNVLVSKYSPLDGSPGDLSKTSIQWPGSGTLTRATS
jgi:hypothetical protein